MSSKSIVTFAVVLLFQQLALSSGFDRGNGNSSSLPETAVTGYVICKDPSTGIEMIVNLSIPGGTATFKQALSAGMTCQVLSKNKTPN